VGAAEDRVKAMRIAILGLGSIGLRHAVNLLALGVDVLGFDPDGERRGKFEAIEGRTTANRERALDKADAVVIASPSSCHLQDIADVVEAGRHLFIEKPLAHSAEGLAELFAEAGNRHLVVCAGLSLRFHPAVELAHDLLAEEAIGRLLWARFLAALYLPDWRPCQDYRKGYAADPRTGGVLFDFQHEFDLAWHFLGPASVSASVARCSGVLGMPSDDCADVLLQHRTAVVSNIHVDYFTRPRRRRVELAGTQGIIDIDIDGRRLVQLDCGGSVLLERSFETQVAEDYVREMENFLAAIHGSEQPRCGGAEALDVLHLVLAARRMGSLPE
jgi:predicted dehydrogenase